jgi:general secretion pathway protein C
MGESAPETNPRFSGSQLREFRKCAQNLNFCPVFSTLRAVLRQGGLRQAAKVAHYLLIVAAAYAAAVVVVKAASLDLHPKVALKSGSETDAVKQVHEKHGVDDAVILRRNLFGAPAVESEEETSAAPSAGAADLKLRGIASSEGRSFAVFENTASGEQNVFGIGDKVFDGPKLVAVDPAGADVLLKGKKRRYDLEEETAKAGEGGDKKKGKAASKGGGKKEVVPTTGGVRKTGDNAYLVDRREIESTIANLNEVITQARAVPVLKDGQSTGFKLFNIRAGSIFEKIGLQDGDIVQKVNNTELTDPSKAVGLLEEVQSMGEIRVNFVRSGTPHSYTYTIR